MTRSIQFAALFALIASASAKAHPAHDAAPPPDHMYDAVGIFLKADAKKRSADIAYEYNERLGWPSMKMSFAVAPELDLSKFRKNARVQFMLHQAPAGSMIIVLMCPTTAEAPVTGHCGPAPATHDGHGGHEGRH